MFVGPGQLTALDIRSGEVRWRRDLPLDTAGDALVAAVGGHVVVLTADGMFVRFDWSDGGEAAAGVWEGPSPLRLVPAGDTVAAGTGGVIVQTAEGDVVAQDVVRGVVRWRARVGRPSAPSVTARRLVLTPTRSGSLTASDAATGETVWTAPVLSTVPCGVSGGEDLTYLVLPEGPIHAFDTRTGTVEWSLEDAQGRGRVYADAQRAASLDGGLLQFIEPQTGQVTGTGSAGGGTRHSVTLGVEHAVAVGSNPVGLGGGNGWVRSIDPVTARSRWLTYLDTPPAASAALVGDQVLVATEGGAVISLSATSGQERWRYDGRLPAVGAPVVAGGTVVVRDLGAGLTALSVTDGAVRWRAQLGLSFQGEPVIASGQVVVRQDERRLIALDLATGERRWETTLSQDMTSPPSVAGTTVYVGTRAGLAAFALGSGTATLNIPFGAPVVTAPVLGRHGAVVCLANGSILALG